MKKILALLCTAMLLAACCIPVFAAGDGSITIQNTVAEHNYSIYKILDLSYDDKGTPEVADDAYTYTINKTSSPWWDFINNNSGSNGNKWFTIKEISTGVYEVTAQGTPDAKLIAEAALTYAAGKPITATATQTATGTSITFSSLEYGYYLIDSSVGTLLSLDTVTPNVIINEKNDEPTIEKTVDETNVNVGDTLNFTITITAQEGAENYELHDKMSAGLTLNETSIGIFAADGTTPIDAAYYTIRTTGTCSAECTFEVEFTDAFCDTLVDNQQIVVKYSAVLNKDAVVGDPGNPNKAVLEYGDDSNIETTPESVVSVKTYEFDLVKTDSTNHLLAGAQFKLYDAATGGNEILLAYDAVEGAYYVTTGAGEAITTNGTGVIKISGLASGTYYLEETVAPTGYNKITERVEVSLSDNLNATMDGTDTTLWTGGGIHIVNNTGAELPSTGGFGTTMFILIGGGLMLCTGILLVAKKRMDKIAD